MKRLTFALIIALLALPALADNCGSEADCQAVPGNTDAATGMAAAGAGAAAFAAAAATIRRRPEPDPVEFAPEEEEGTGTTGSLEDIFGAAEPETPIVEEGPVRRGPPDIALGLDPPKPTDDPGTPR